jgi:hypothetical protein
VGWWQGGWQGPFAQGLFYQRMQPGGCLCAYNCYITITVYTATRNPLCCYQRVIKWVFVRNWGCLCWLFSADVTVLVPTKKSGELYTRTFDSQGNFVHTLTRLCWLSSTDVMVVVPMNHEICIHKLALIYAHTHPCTHTHTHTRTHTYTHRHTHHTHTHTHTYKHAYLLSHARSNAHLPPKYIMPAGSDPLRSPTWCFNPQFRITVRKACEVRNACVHVPVYVCAHVCASVCMCNYVAFVHTITYKR